MPGITKRKLKEKGEDVALGTFFRTNQAARELGNLLSNIGVGFGAPAALPGMLKAQKAKRGKAKLKEKATRERIMKQRAALKRIKK